MHGSIEFFWVRWHFRRILIPNPNSNFHFFSFSTHFQANFGPNFRKKIKKKIRIRVRSEIRLETWKKIRTWVRSKFASFRLSSEGVCMIRLSSFFFFEFGLNRTTESEPNRTGYSKMFCDRFSIFTVFIYKK
jgi:hypothetical protein